MRCSALQKCKVKTLDDFVLVLKKSPLSLEKFN
jgi:hypothetical protein